MPNYQDGKIYKIYNTINDNFYVGSTTQKLSQRMKDHRSNCKRLPHLFLYKEMIEYGKEHFYIELLEKYPCNDKEELAKKEGEYIRSLKPPMNQRMLILYDNRPERYKQYYELNKDRIKEKQNPRNKQYYEQNKEKIKNYKVECECGCVVTRHNLQQHKQTKKHKKLIAN